MEAFVRYLTFSRLWQSWVFGHRLAVVWSTQSSFVHICHPNETSVNPYWLQLFRFSLKTHHHWNLEFNSTTLPANQVPNKVGVSMEKSCSFAGLSLTKARTKKRWSYSYITNDTEEISLELLIISGAVLENEMNKRGITKRNGEKTEGKRFSQPKTCMGMH